MDETVPDFRTVFKKILLGDGSPSVQETESLEQKQQASKNKSKCNFSLCLVRQTNNEPPMLSQSKGKYSICSSEKTHLTKPLEVKEQASKNKSNYNLPLCSFHQTDKPIHQSKEKHSQHYPQKTHSTKPLEVKEQASKNTSKYNLPLCSFHQTDKPIHQSKEKYSQHYPQKTYMTETLESGQQVCENKSKYISPACSVITQTDHEPIIQSRKEYIQYFPQKIHGNKPLEVKKQVFNQKSKCNYPFCLVSQTDNGPIISQSRGKYRPTHHYSQKVGGTEVEKLFKENLRFCTQKTDTNHFHETDSNLSHTKNIVPANGCISNAHSFTRCSKKTNAKHISESDVKNPFCYSKTREYIDGKVRTTIYIDGKCIITEIDANEEQKRIVYPDESEENWDLPLYAGMPTSY